MSVCYPTPLFAASLTLPCCSGCPANARLQKSPTAQMIVFHLRPKILRPVASPARLVATLFPTRTNAQVLLPPSIGMLTNSDGSPTFLLICPPLTPLSSSPALPLPPPLRPPSLLNHRHGPPAPPRNPRLTPNPTSPGHRPSVEGLNVPRRSVFSTFVPTLT
jgi:hypothetical protein